MTLNNCAQMISSLLLTLLIDFSDCSLGEGSYFKEFGTYIGRLRAYSQGISGQVYVVDDRHLFISNFRYDATGPAAYFTVGDGAMPSPRGIIVPYPPIVEDTLMPAKNFFENPVDTFQRVNSKTQYQSPFGTPPTNMQSNNNYRNNNNNYMNQNIKINNNMVNNRRGGGHKQGNRRRIAYVVPDGLPNNNNNINNNNNNVGNLGTMNLNGNVGLGTFGFADGSSPADMNDFKTSKNMQPPLVKMTNENVLLKLPNSLRVSDIRWLSVWCTRFTVNYGEVYFPNNIPVPKSVMLEPFPNEGDKLRSGPIRILDSKSFYVPNLHLMVMEPGYHFWAGKSSIPNGGPDNSGQMVPNEKDRFDDLTPYSGSDLILTLPNALTVYDINYLAIYNEGVQHSIGHVSFNVTNARIPPALGQTKKPGWWFSIPVKPTEPPHGKARHGAGRKHQGRGRAKDKLDEVPFNHELELPNCRELLGRKIRLQWMNEGGHVYFRIKVHMDPRQFAAVGIAARGSPNIEADLVKIYFNETANRYMTEDNFLARQLLCDFSNGLCPDTSHQSQDNIRYMGSLKHHGLSIVDFRRSIIPGDMHDAPISLDGPTQVIVAIGSMQAERSPYGMGRSLNMEMENTTIDFSLEQDENTCPDVTNIRKFEEPDPEEVWERTIIRDENYLVAMLGPSGGSKGYAAITGDNPAQHSVVWWINQRLLPEIVVERGKTYFFRIQGGDDRNNLKNYHPLYITSDHGGGYFEKNPAERKLETIYAGIDNVAGQEVPTGVGPLCTYTSEGADKAAESETFEDYFATLTKACEPGREHEYGWVNWTVAMDTPNLVYYQSYTGWKLGWKILVVNEGESATAGAAMTTATAAALSLITTGVTWLACIAW